MTATYLAPSPIQKFWDNNGQPLAYGLVSTYAAGSTTPIATYTDSTGNSQNTNPIVLNARGECSMWLLPNVGYKIAVTDSLGNNIPGYPVDNIVNSQLITLYGGVDTGSANAYILTFNANFTAYQDGIVIYWIPSHTNTGASTINVNGLGPISITNQDGSALVTTQLIANQVSTIMYKGGNFLLLSSGIAASIVTGSWVPTWTGFSVAPTGTMFYSIIGPMVILGMSINGTGTSNSTSMAINNIPSIIKPSTGGTGRSPCIVTDNGTVSQGAFDFVSNSIVFYIGSAPSTSGFTNSGSKGLGFGWTGVYYRL